MKREEEGECERGRREARREEVDAKRYYCTVFLYDNKLLMTGPFVATDFISLRRLPTPSVIFRPPPPKSVSHASDDLILYMLYRRQNSPTSTHRIPPQIFQSTLLRITPEYLPSTRTVTAHQQALYRCLRGRPRSSPWSHAARYKV